MSNLDKKQDRSNFQPNEDSQIEKKPSELLAQILFFLKGKNSETNTDANIQSIAAAQRKAFSMVKDFARFLGENLPKTCEIQKKLFQIGDRQKQVNHVDVIEIKSSANDLKDDISYVLKDLKKEDLKRLEELSKVTPEFLQEGIFTLTKNYKEIMDEHNPTKKKSILKEIVESLLGENRFNAALKATELVPEAHRANVLATIALDLTQKGELDHARKVVKMISESDAKPPKEL